MYFVNLTVPFSHSTTSDVSAVIWCQVRTRHRFLKFADSHACRGMVLNKQQLPMCHPSVSNTNLSQSHPRQNARGYAKYRDSFFIMLFISTGAIAQHIIFWSLAETCTVCVAYLFGRDRLFTRSSVTKLAGSSCLFIYLTPVHCAVVETEIYQKERKCESVIGSADEYLWT